MLQIHTLTEEFDFSILIRQKRKNRQHIWVSFLIRAVLISALQNKINFTFFLLGAFWD